MRIIYDDSQAHLAVDIIDECMEAFKDSMEYFIRYEPEYKLPCIQPDLVHKRLNERLKKHGFRIGNTVTHAYGIDDNCAYKVYFDTPNESQECCTLHINCSSNGQAYLYLEDYDGNKISKAYRLTFRGIKEI